MAHLSWYRKYRPQTFDDVVGQSHIERTLRNAVAEGTVAHAYLFTGPRGTGKTTTARILAKALNCEQGPTPTPDDTCDQCRAIADGMHPDVLELDAASRRGIDDVREQIIGRVKFAPSRGTWKVYIIDEVHMLTREAFNALLKTFEEPPPHTVFVLATTDPHKVPETIHSRCQRFDFHRLSIEDIVSRLRVIADAEHVNVPDAALTLVARHALGGMRDAITTLEQLASFGGGTIAIEDVEELLGEVDAELLFTAATLILDRDVAGAFRFVAELAEAGIDMSEFVKGLVLHFRNLFVLAAVGPSDAVDATSEHRVRLADQADRYGVDRAARILEILARLTGDLRYASDQRLAVEVALTRMARPHADLTVESIAERVAALESGAPIRDALMQDAVTSERPAPSPTPVAKKAPAAVAPEPTPEVKPAPRTAPAPAPRTSGESVRLDVASVKRAWPAVLAEFKKRKPSRGHAFDGTEAETDGELLIVEFPAGQALAMELVGDGESLALLRRCVGTVLGVEPPLEYRLGRGGRSKPAKAQTPEEAEPTDAPSAPAPAKAAEKAPPPAAASGEDGSDADLEAQVIAELGAQVLGESDAD